MILSFNFWTSWLISTKYGMNIMPLEATKLHNFNFLVINDNMVDA